MPSPGVEVRPGGMSSRAEGMSMPSPGVEVRPRGMSSRAAVMDTAGPPEQSRRLQSSSTVISAVRMIERNVPPVERGVQGHGDGVAPRARKADVATPLPYLSIAQPQQRLEHRPVYPRSGNRGFASHGCVAPRSLGATQRPRVLHRALPCSQLRASLGRANRSASIHLSPTSGQARAKLRRREPRPARTRRAVTMIPLPRASRGRERSLPGCSPGPRLACAPG